MAIPHRLSTLLNLRFKVVERQFVTAWSFIPHSRNGEMWGFCPFQLIFRLQRLDILPVDDLGIRAGIRKIYSLPELPHRKTIISLGQKWQPYRSIAAWYLWQSLTLN